MRRLVVGATIGLSACSSSDDPRFGSGSGGVGAQGGTTLGGAGGGAHGGSAGEYTNGAGGGGTAQGGSGGMSSGGSTPGGSGGGGGGGTSGGTEGGGGTLQTCSLALVNQGQLPPPFLGHSRLNSIDVAPSQTGFVIVYREHAHTGSMQLSSVPIDDSGGAGTPLNLKLQSCSFTDIYGTAVDFHGDTGVAATALPDCANTGPGLAVAGLTPAGLDGSLNIARYPGTTALRLARHSGLAAIPGTADYELAYYEQDTQALGKAVVVDANGVKPGAVHTPLFNRAEVSSAQTARTNQIRAYLGGRPTGMHFSVVDYDGNQTSSDIEFGSWSSLVAWQDRAAALVEAANKKTANYTVKDSKGALLAAGSVPTTELRSGDLTVAGDYLVLLLGHLGRLTIARIPGVIGNLGSPETSSFTNFGGTPLEPLAGYRVAAAAARGLLLVTWLSHDDPQAGVNVGGWALLRCGS
ncbi:MAG: hypothetical protein H6718_24450 [Polyangiaceae bacterium]|nr:hypothetical protein [Polyangiaceae bacterium]